MQRGNGLSSSHETLVVNGSSHKPKHHQRAVGLSFWNGFGVGLRRIRVEGFSTTRTASSTLTASPACCVQGRYMVDQGFGQDRLWAGSQTSKTHTYMYIYIYICICTHTHLRSNQP